LANKQSNSSYYFLFKARSLALRGIFFGKGRKPGVLGDEGGGELSSPSASPSSWERASRARDAPAKTPLETAMSEANREKG